MMMVVGLCAPGGRYYRGILWGWGGVALQERGTPLYLFLSLLFCHFNTLFMQRQNVKTKYQHLFRILKKVNPLAFNIFSSWILTYCLN